MEEFDRILNNIDKRLDRMEVKVDQLIEFRFKIIGGSVVLSVIFSVLTSVLMKIL